MDKFYFENQTQIFYEMSNSIPCFFFPFSHFQFNVAIGFMPQDAKATGTKNLNFDWSKSYSPSRPDYSGILAKTPARSCKYYVKNFPKNKNRSDRVAPEATADPRFTR